MWETWVWSLGWEDILETGKATHSSILAWRIPWTVYSPWGRKELDTTEWLSLTHSRMNSGGPRPIGAQTWTHSVALLCNSVPSQSLLLPISQTHSFAPDLENWCGLSMALMLDLILKHTYTLADGILVQPAAAPAPPAPAPRPLLPAHKSTVSQEGPGERKSARSTSQHDAGIPERWLGGGHRRWTACPAHLAHTLTPRVQANVFSHPPRSGSCFPSFLPFLGSLSNCSFCFRHPDPQSWMRLLALS